MKTWEELTSCKTHGEFIGKFYNINGDKKYGGACQQCLKAADKKEQEYKDKEEKGRAAARRIRARENSGISKRNLFKTFDDYICTNEGQSKAKNDCVRFTESFPSDKSLIMSGDVGTGKTLLASAIVDALVDDYRCEIVKVIELVRSLKATWSKDSKETEEELIRYFVGLDLLILDEVGTQFGSDTEKLFVFDIIDGRYQDMKQTVLISNLDIDGIKDAIGERCVDRLREGGGMMIAFDWKSLRQ